MLFFCSRLRVETRGAPLLLHKGGNPTPVFLGYGRFFFFNFFNVCSRKPILTLLCLPVQHQHCGELILEKTPTPTKKKKKKKLYSQVL